VVQNGIDKAVERLEAAHPEWDVWVVYRAVGGVVWCARRRDGEGKVINEDSPTALSAAIGKANRAGC
jgi:hypothetical protein